MIRAHWHRLLVAAGAAVIASGWLTAPAGEAAGSTGGIRFWSDYAAFRLEAGVPEGYVEFYFELKRVDFEFRDLDGHLRADVYAWVHISDTSGQAVDSVGGAFVAAVRDSTELADSNFTLFFARALVLPPGEFIARVVVADLTSKATGETTYPVRVPSFATDVLYLSDIEFGYNIVDKSADSLSVRDVLVKSGQKVYPDCRGLVGPSRPRLLFYAEVYNFAFDPARDNQYHMEVTVTPFNSTSPLKVINQTPTKPGADAVLTSGVNTRDLAAGNYYLRVRVTDPQTAQTATAEKVFRVVPPRVDSLSPEDVQRVRDIISYIARPGEMARFSRLNAVGKYNFFIQFWKERDPTPGTPENEAKTEHMRRMNYANEHFSIGYETRTNGWRTDMGRVYIVYGPPDYIERYPFTPENPAAEQWFYDHLPGQGQALFLYIDESGYGDYNLVHSTARGERRDPYWEKQLRDGIFERTQ